MDRQTRTLFPLTDEAITLYLSGKMTVGLYPLLVDETCWLLAVDFDKKAWQQDAIAFVSTCRRHAVHACLERSRSGNGGHAWMFFASPLPAVMARKMGCAFLTETMNRRHQLGLSSYDRFFPNQDTMPKGGYGNLIALPLQWMPRQSSNSVFVDDHLNPYPDQWQLLASVERIPADQVDWIVKDASRRGQIIAVRMAIAESEDEPWALPPSQKTRESRIEGTFPVSVDLVLSDLVYVPGRHPARYGVKHDSG